LNIEQRLIDFGKSLSDFAPTESASWQLAEIFNALLAEVRAAYGDDPVVAVIQPAEQSSIPTESTTNAGTLRAAASQLRNVVRGN
jgi:hypothetical protein